MRRLAFAVAAVTTVVVAATDVTHAGYVVTGHGGPAVTGPSASMLTTWTSEFDSHLNGSEYAGIDPSGKLGTAASFHGGVLDTRGYSGVPDSWSKAVWNDVLHVAGKTSELVRLVYHVEGVYSLNPDVDGYLPYTASSFEIGAWAGTYGNSALFDLLYRYGYEGPGVYSSALSLWGWDRSDIEPILVPGALAGHFHADFSFEIPSDREFTVTLQSHAYAAAGDATSDFGHTAVLSSVLVQNTDGEWVDASAAGVAYSFESGMTPAGSAVPEPGTLALMGLGSIGMGFAGWRKKRRAVLAA